MADTETEIERAQAVGIEDHVIRRYASAAQAVEPALCCPTNTYDPQYLAAIPQEILDKDYGCGDPTRYVSPGETVIDLGSGGGKVCYILAQKLGPEGTVIGVDFNDTMLDLARSYQSEMTQKLGYGNTVFVKARIQDMRLDLEAAEARLRQSPINSMADLAAFETYCDALRAEAPAVADGTADVVVSNCVLNLVRQEHKQQLFQEIHRVLKRGGRAVISDIVCDEPPTDAIRNDPELWSGCIAGAFTETGFLNMFAAAGFYGIEILERQEEPWRTIDGIEFRSLTVRAYKGKEGPCLERNQAVVYKGPWSAVKDDDGHTYYRGQRMAVCDKTFTLLNDPNGPYHEQMVAIAPLNDIPLAEAEVFACKAAAVRSPRQTKGMDYRATTEAEACGIEGCC